MGKLHVLIIDDDRINVDILVRLLDLLDVSSTAILESHSVEELLPDLPALDVVFLDLEMPELNGYEVLRNLKDRYGVTAPIVAYTVHTSESVNAVKEGFDGFMAKPLNAELFPDLFWRILNGERVWKVRW